MRAFILISFFLLSPLARADVQFAVPVPPLNDQQALGAAIFQDTNLSRPHGQSCASCHRAGAAFTDFRPPNVVSAGAVPQHFGNRNTPSLLYAMFIPPLQLQPGDDGPDYIGGLFWDGRANSLASQVEGPFFNPDEMNSTRANVVSDACGSAVYGPLLRKLYGDAVCPAVAAASPTALQVENTFTLIANAVASFEHTKGFAPFSSKFDKVQAGLDRFSEEEQRGFEVYKDEKRGNCVACHVLDVPAGLPGPLFTDFSYDNLGIPVNPALAFYGHPEIDQGLFATTHREEDHGRFRSSTMRNIALTAPYGHNGYFRTLEQIIDFYSTRDLKPRCAGILTSDQAEAQNCWPAPEVPEDENLKELGKMNLSQDDVKALVAFLGTLTDGYWPH